MFGRGWCQVHRPQREDASWARVPTLRSDELCGNNFTKRPEGASRYDADGTASDTAVPRGRGNGSPPRLRRTAPLAPSPPRGVPGRTCASPPGKFATTRCRRRSLGPNYTPGAKRRGGAACLGVPRLVVVVKSWCSSSRRRRLVDDSSTSRKRRADLDLRPELPRKARSGKALAYREC